MFEHRWPLARMVSITVLAIAAACGTSSSPTQDAGMDASVEASTDAPSADAQLDARVDATDADLGDAVTDAVADALVCTVLSCGNDNDCGQGCGPCFQSFCLGYNVTDQ